MEEAFTVYMDENPLAFTEDGRVAVLDAIRMVLDSDSAPVVWEKMKEEHPEILRHCQDRATVAFQGAQQPPCFQIPHLYHLVPRPGYYVRSVLTHRHRCYSPRVAFEGAQPE